MLSLTGAHFMSLAQPLRYACIVFFVMVIAMLPASAQRKSISLNTNWEFRQLPDASATAEIPWHPAQVPGVVHTDLLQNKLIPDPFYRANEGTLQWIENASWEYRSAFQAASDV